MVKSNLDEKVTSESKSPWISSRPRVLTSIVSVDLKRKLADAEEQLTALWQGPEITKHKVSVDLSSTLCPILTILVLQYVLRGVSYFTGWASPSSYVTYVRNDEGQWWKICQQEAQKVSRAGLRRQSASLLIAYRLA